MRLMRKLTLERLLIAHGLRIRPLITRILRVRVGRITTLESYLLLIVFLSSSVWI